MSAPPPIFTLTGNLLAERTLTFDAWSAGRTQRATAESFQVGGKPRSLPILKINPAVTDIFGFQYTDFELQNYDPHPAIKAQVSV